MGTAAAFTIRLVSKSWCAAFSEVAATVKIKGDKPDQLKALCRLLPHTRELNLNKASTRLDFNWTAHLSLLTCLTIHHDVSELPHGRAMDCELSSLPTSLRDLRLFCVHLVPAPVDEVNLPLLTSLHFNWKPDTPNDSWSSLLCLPALKVSHLEGFCA